MQKTFTLFLLLLSSTHYAHGQFYKSILPSEAFSDSISIIVQDFKKNFLTIEGGQLLSQGDMDLYASKATVPGAMHCTIYRFHSLQDTTASWQATMYEGDSYEMAVKIYKNTFRLLKKSNMKWVDKSSISFTGELEIPKKNIGFTVTSLRLNTADILYRNFFGEIELISTYDGWEVHLNLHNKKNDAEKF